MTSTNILDNLTSHELVESGLESTVHRVKDQQGSSFILKKRKNTGQHNYFFEAYAYRELHRLGAKVPQVLFVDARQILLSLLPGFEMDDKEDLYNDEALFAEIAHNLAICADIHLHGFGDPLPDGAGFRGKYDTWRDFLKSNDILFKSDLMLASGIKKDEIEKLWSFWQKGCDDIQLRQGCLVHGDFAMSAIFANGRQFTGIIDFGDAIIGDPLMDIAYFRFKEITKDYGLDIYRHLLKHYCLENKLSVNEKEVEYRILFYMIYWGVVRINNCPDPAILQKFVDKLKAVATLI